MSALHVSNRQPSEPLRAGRTDEEVSSAVAQLWRGRTDRYSETRTVDTSGLARGAKKVEMSYIGG